jgi:hypothetical protein
MSKKSRRERTPNLPPEAFNVPAASPKAAPASESTTVAAVTAATTATGANRRATASAAASVAVDWKAEYGEVIGDLWRTFLIFAGLVVAMIALSFVIR